MRKTIRFIGLVMITILYCSFQATTYYNEQKSERSLITSKLALNLKTLEEHPLNETLAEYDKKYGTTLNSYSEGELAASANVIESKTHQGYSACFSQTNCFTRVLIHHTKQRIKEKNSEPFWSIDAIMKCFVYPLLALILGSWILKKMKIL